jgi:BMC domain
MIFDSALGSLSSIISASRRRIGSSRRSPRQWRKGNLLLPRSSLFVLEATPAAYVTLAANEAEKAASISLIEVRAVGRFGRLFVSGTESEVQAAAKAAIASLEEYGGRE